MAAVIRSLERETGQKRVSVIDVNPFTDVYEYFVIDFVDWTKDLVDRRYERGIYSAYIYMRIGSCGEESECSLENQPYEEYDETIGLTYSFVSIREYTSAYVKTLREKEIKERTITILNMMLNEIKSVIKATQLQIDDVINAIKRLETELTKKEYVYIVPNLERAEVHVFYIRYI